MVKVLFRRPCHVPPCLITGKEGVRAFIGYMIMQLHMQLFPYAGSNADVSALPICTIPMWYYELEAPFESSTWSHLVLNWRLIWKPPCEVTYFLHPNKCNSKISHANRCMVWHYNNTPYLLWEWSKYCIIFFVRILRKLLFFMVVGSK